MELTGTTFTGSFSNLSVTGEEMSLAPPRSSYSLLLLKNCASKRDKSNFMLVISEMLSEQIGKIPPLWNRKKPHHY